ncbi:hypothetical protein BLA29_013536, partial [Euroglyphus maynei]
EKEKINDRSTKSPEPSSIKRSKPSDLLLEETSLMTTTTINEDEPGVGGSSGDDCCSNKSENQSQDPNSIMNTQNCM